MPSLVTHRIPDVPKAVLRRLPSGVTPHSDLLRCLTMHPSEVTPHNVAHSGFQDRQWKVIAFTWHGKSVWVIGTPPRVNQVLMGRRHSMKNRHTGDTDSTTDASGWHVADGSGEEADEFSGASKLVPGHTGSVLRCLKSEQADGRLTTSSLIGQMRSLLLC